MKGIKILGAFLALFMAHQILSMNIQVYGGIGEDKKLLKSYFPANIKDIAQLKKALSKDLGLPADTFKILSSGRELSDDIKTSSLAKDILDRLLLMKNKAPEEEYEITAPGGVGFKEGVVKGPKAPDVAAKAGNKAARLKDLKAAYLKLREEGHKLADETGPYSAKGLPAPEDLQRKADSLALKKYINQWWQNFIENPRSIDQLNKEYDTLRTTAGKLNAESAALTGKSAPEELKRLYELQKQLEDLEVKKATIRDAKKELEGEAVAAAAPKEAEPAARIDPVAATKVLAQMRDAIAKTKKAMNDKIEKTQKEFVETMGMSKEDASQLTLETFETEIKQTDANNKKILDQIKQIEATLAAQASKAAMGTPAAPAGKVGAEVAAAAGKAVAPAAGAVKAGGPSVAAAAEDEELQIPIDEEFQIPIRYISGKIENYTITPKIQTFADLKKIIAIKTGLATEAQSIIISGLEPADTDYIKDWRTRISKLPSIHLTPILRAAGAELAGAVKAGKGLPPLPPLPPSANKITVQYEDAEGNILHNWTVDISLDKKISDLRALLEAEGKINPLAREIEHPAYFFDAEGQPIPGRKVLRDTDIINTRKVILRAER